MAISAGRLANLSLRTHLPKLKNRPVSYEATRQSSRFPASGKAPDGLSARFHHWGYTTCPERGYQGKIPLRNITGMQPAFHSVACPNSPGWSDPLPRIRSPLNHASTWIRSSLRQVPDPDRSNLKTLQRTPAGLRFDVTIQH